MSNEILDDLRWRDEILQLMYWLRGEQLRERVCAADLLPFLSCNETQLERHLQSAADEGFLACDSAQPGKRYWLTELGKREGGRSFAADFADMTKPAHAECPPN